MTDKYRSHTLQREALAVFAESLEVPDADQQAWLTRRCAGNPAAAEHLSAAAAAAHALRAEKIFRASRDVPDEWLGALDEFQARMQGKR